jgi:hypothetical protein
MKRALFGSLALIAVGLMAGCGGGYNGSLLGGGGTPQPNALNGQYAFVLTGFDSSGNPMGMAGSFKADGVGHISAGEVDVNDNGTVSSSTSVAGTYAFDANGLGSLVTVALTNTVGSIAHPLQFGIALQAGGTFGDIMSVDANNFIVAGTIQQQNSSVFSLAGLAADYIITLNGRNAAVPTSALGRFTLGASGTSTNVLFDRSIAGVGSAAASSAVVTFGSAGPDSNGRGTLTVTINDTLTPASGTQNFAYYAITANRFVAVETDATGTMIVNGSKQSLSSFTASSVNTTGSVFGVAGLDTAVAIQNEISAAGRLVISGSNSATLLVDSNDGGGIIGPTTLSGPVVFDPTTGRGTITLTNGSANGLFDSAVFYLTDSGTGSILDTVATTSNRAMAGPLTAQSGSSFALSTIPGQMIVRARGSSVNDAQTLAGTIVATTTSGVYNFDLDQRFPSNSSISTQTDGAIPGVSVLALDATNGRGTMSIPTTTSTGAPTTATEVFYVIGANQMVFIDVSPVSSQVNGASPLFFVNPF